MATRSNLFPHLPIMKIGHYTLGETLGVGSFGKVKIGSHQLTNHEVAVKILNREKIKSFELTSNVRREIQHLKHFRHPHIIKLYQVISTASDIFMIMEYAPGGDIFDYIIKKGKLEEKEARRLFQQIISGIDYCHQFLRTSCGSPNYAAPEVIIGKLYAGPEVDIWSCGVILYALLSGKLPFDDEHVPILFKKITCGYFHVPKYLDKCAVSLVQRMLHVNPLMRASIDEIKNHKWFQQDLPSNLFPLPNENLEAVDLEAVIEVCLKFGVQVNEVNDALLNGDPHDELAIAYHLIVDNKAITDDEFSPSIQTISQNPILNLDSEFNFNKGLEKDVNKLTANKGEWHLGIRSQSKPWEIMNELFKAMKSLDFEWKLVDSYHVHVRTKKPNTKDKYIVISLQLYQIDKKYNLIDFKSISSDLEIPPVTHEIENRQTSTHYTMGFLQMCASLIAHLMQ
uniref:non-specific serine/threonine protein kinase n=1 Tax=Rhodnius prolixus TaxID=13249 RepID=T1HLY3_RHOPR